ncbi:MAG: hypothetical protein R3324_10325, partial [Halobacteriales archaeon]|nr:hypothetical protein [Halobacteriales archaeon]
MRRNVIIDTRTGRYQTGAPLGADIVDVALSAEVAGGSTKRIGAIYLFEGPLDERHCSAWLGVVGGGEAELDLVDADSGVVLMTFSTASEPGPVSPEEGVQVM